MRGFSLKRKVFLALALTIIAAFTILPILQEQLSKSGTAAAGAESNIAVQYSACELRLVASGGGSLLVNGSKVAEVFMPRPFRALVEAVPERCYRLKQLLVNGTPAGASKLELLVAGNTTVEALFERWCALVRFEVVKEEGGEGRLYVNGSEVSSGEELLVEPGAALLASAIPARGQAEVYVDGSLASKSRTARTFLLRPRGDTLVRVVFAKARVVLSVDTSGLEARFRWPGGERLVTGSAELEVEEGAIVEAEVLPAVKNGCTLRPLGWELRRGASPLFETLPANFTRAFDWDSSLKLVVREECPPPPPAPGREPVRGGVIVNGKEVESKAVYRLPHRRADTRIEYLGGGTWYIENRGGDTFFIELPSGWRTVTVEVWVGSGCLDLAVYVTVTENTYRGVGATLGAGAYRLVTLARDGTVVRSVGHWDTGYAGSVERHPDKIGWLLLSVYNLDVTIKVTVES